MQVWEVGEWQGRSCAHTDLVDAELADVYYRRDRGLKHPVDDFLFHYYNLRPAQLRQWHPGFGVGVMGAESWVQKPFYRLEEGTVSVDVSAFMAKRSKTVEQGLHLLKAAAQTPKFGCFGMHEWAMVYGLEPGETRHPYLKLRFPADEIRRIVEEVGCRCSHFDAFRFFTPAARPLNIVQPTRGQQAGLDQPGCLHVNMDLYRWAGKLLPLISSELLFATFRLAREIRRVDMAASAYDLSGWGLEPIQVETTSGRFEYAQLQRGFAERGKRLRDELVQSVEAAVISATPNQSVGLEPAKS